MQKIIFYQELQPKAADALWLHHGYDSDGNKKESISIDYIQNGVVRHITAAGGEDVSKIIASEENNFDSTKSYSAGDVVVKDGALYTFTSDHAAGEWNENEVEVIDVLSLIDELGSEVASASEDRSVLHGQIETLQGQVTSISEAIGSLNGQIETLQGQVTSLKKALGTLAAGDTLCFSSLTENSKIRISKEGTLSITPSLEYSTDGMTWQAYTIGTYIPADSVGDTVYFRSDGTTTTFSESEYKYLYFVMSGRFAASGSVMSLIDKNLEGNVNVGSYCFYYLFKDCTGLTVAPELPATTLANNCYNNMFYGCTGLTTVPVLPATTLANYCYKGMFSGCAGLTTAPALPATTLTSNCYSAMFNNCTSLTSAPELPATTLAERCYSNMFANCTSLTTAPEELPATTLANSCYIYMFQSCTSLTTAPELPATTLADSCYSYMFRYCSHLSRIKAMFTSTPTTTFTKSWVEDVAAEGVFVKNAEATWNVTGKNGIPTGWTVETASE